MPNKIRIISIDGGGIRGIIPAVILSHVEKRIQDEKGPDARLADHVELVAGTSTGGIIACAMLMPDTAVTTEVTAPPRPRYTMDEVADIYLQRGAEIFSRTPGHWLRTWGGLRDEKYDAAGLERALKEKFDDIRLAELLRPCLITAYDIRYRETVFFGQHKARADRGRDHLVRHVARATSAAPTYFEAANIPSVMEVYSALVDGGVFANNPAMCAYAEARGMNFGTVDRPTSKDMFMLSLGTGTVKKEYPHHRAKDFGMVQWVRPVIDIMMSGNSETVSFQVQKLFEAGENPEGFIRTEPGLHNASPDMDDASPKNLAALKEAGTKYVADNPDIINSIVRELIG
jgi:patatin-like phospholipase/acyl hydrolase